MCLVDVGDGAVTVTVDRPDKQNTSDQPLARDEVATHILNRVAA